MRTAIVTFTIAFLAACRLSPVASDPTLAPSRLPQWCVTVKVKLDGTVERLTGCAETLPLCEKGRTEARKLGVLSPVKRVGECTATLLVVDKPAAGDDARSREEPTIAPVALPF